jgi:hypothetical protein
MTPQRTQETGTWREFYDLCTVSQLYNESMQAVGERGVRR